MTYRNIIHATLYKTFVVLCPYKLSGRFLAALFFLTASKDLWDRAKRAINGKNIDFDSIDKNEMGCYSYTLLSLARDFYSGSTHATLYDIGNTHLFSDQTVDMIVSAIGISRKGYEYIGINKKFD